MAALLARKQASSGRAKAAQPRAARGGGLTASELADLLLAALLARKSAAPARASRPEAPAEPKAAELADLLLKALLAARK